MNNRLTRKELDVLSLLWRNEEPLIASDITKTDGSLNINTVHAVLRGLLKRGYIEVADIVYSGTVLCRRYRPTKKSQDIAAQHLADQLRSLAKNVPPSMLFAALLECREDSNAMIDELEEIIREKKKALRGE